MRALVFADLQADEGSDRLRSDPSTPLQRWRVQRFYKWAAGVAASYGCDAVWDLGDTTNNRTSLSHHTVQAVARGSALLTSGRPAVTNFKLIGNHEQHMKARETHVGDLFSPYFRVVEDRDVFHLPGALTVVCASFQYEYGDLSDWLYDAVDRAKARQRRVVVLGHFLVAGSRLSSGVSSSAQSVPMEVLAAADLVLLGHVHRRQRVGGNGWYVGSPFQQDFGEAGDPTKAVAVLDTDTLAIEWVSSPFPVHRTVTVDELPSAAATNDVLKVLVRSTAEAERLYASPHAGTVEPVYAFQDAVAAPRDRQEDLSSYMEMARRYTEVSPLPGVEPDELLREAQRLQHEA